MFGLMKFRAKAPATLPAQHQRLHYCGVCKAMGRQYGQRTRVMLNYDAIFLSELLTFLGPMPDSYAKEWSPALLSYNCLRLPKTEDIPTPLRYAAAVNVLLAGVKLEDNRQDRGGFIWRTAGKLYAERTQQAERDLAAWGLDLEEIDQWLRTHQAREQEAAQSNPARHLAHLAEATSRITGKIFAQGAIAIGQESQVGKMEILGRDFGKLIYLLDAYRDYGQDQRKGEYNPIRTAYGLADGSSQMPGEAREALQTSLLQTSRLMLQTIADLPLREDGRQWFRDRIEENLSQQLGLSREEIASCTTAPSQKKPKVSLRSRFGFVDKLAGIWHHPRIRQRNGYWRTGLAFGTVALLAILFPNFLHARADWFSHIDPDFLSRFGDLHPDWLPKDPTTGGCECDDCCRGCGDGCGDCCNNASNDCERTCNRCITILIVTIITFVVGLALLIFFIVRGRRRAAAREAEYLNAHLDHQPPPANPFKTVVHRSQTGTEVLLAAAHDWFGHHYPEAMPQLVAGDNYRTLQATVETPIRSEIGGIPLDLGRVSYRIRIYIRTGALALEFDQFEHIGSEKCPAGGSLARSRPITNASPLDDKAWRSIKSHINQKVRAQLDGFQNEV